MAISLSIVLSVIFLAQSVPYEDMPVQTTIISQQNVDDVFTLLDTTGYILTTLDSNSPSNAVGFIYNRASLSLPSNMNLRIQLQQYVTDNMGACKADRNFSSCFPDANRTISTAGLALPTDKSIIRGKKIYVRRQPPSDCNLTYAVTAPVIESPFCKPSQNDILFDHHPFPSINFQAEDLNLVFDVNVVPPSSIQCDQNVTINLSVTVPEYLRDPVDIMLVMDRSGSMSWVGRYDTSDASRLDVNGNYTYLADGSGDFRVLDTTDPGIPTQAGRDTFSGSAEDVVVDYPYAYVAAGSRSLKVFDISDPTDPEEEGSWDVGSSGRGIDKSGDYVYLAHYYNGIRVINVSDPENPFLVDTWNPGWQDQSYDVAVQGNYAYVADDDRGMVILDITDPNNVVYVTRCENSAPCSINSGTNSRAVHVEGNYAYLSQRERGMRIIDISNPANPVLTGTYNPSGYVYGIDVVGNTAYLATDGDGLIEVDITNKANPVLIEMHESPYSYFDVEINNNWAHIAAGSYGLITIDLNGGLKIDQAIEAAKDFVDANSWRAEDQLGLVSYASSASLDEQLTNDRNAVKDALDALSAGGGTATGDGIYEATDELTSGRANPVAYKFQVLLSDGQTNQGSSSAAAASDAASNGIVIYTIGFGPDADAAELTNIANLTGGEYYAAADVNSLSTIYLLIEQEIQEVASNALLNAVVTDSNFVVDTGGAVLLDQNLMFDINTVSPNNPWFGSYILNFPCDSDISCTFDVLSFPGPGSFFEYTDSNGTHRIEFDVNTTVSFQKRDITVEIIEGKVTAPDNVLLDVNVANIADLNTGSTVLNLYLNDTNSVPLTSRFVPELCGGTNSFCSPSEHLYLGIVLNVEGIIYATVNDDLAISECPGNNEDVISCFGAPRIEYYILDYWAWRD